jgi:hypothetical protein
MARRPTSSSTRTRADSICKHKERAFFFLLARTVKELMGGGEKTSQTRADTRVLFVVAVEVAVVVVVEAPLPADAAAAGAAAAAGDAAAAVAFGVVVMVQVVINTHTENVTNVFPLDEAKRRQEKNRKFLGSVERFGSMNLSNHISVTISQSRIEIHSF